MVNIIYYPSMLKLTVSGHAHSGPKGGDIVCAAVSALEFTLIENLNVFYRQGLAIPVVIMRRDLDEVVCVPLKRDDARVRDAFETVACGMSLLAERCPRHVSFVSQ